MNMDDVWINKFLRPKYLVKSEISIPNNNYLDTSYYAIQTSLHMPSCGRSAHLCPQYGKVDEFDILQ